MKQYVIDELRSEDYEKIRQYFNDNLKVGAIEGVYWLKIPESLLTGIQSEHDQCQPYYFAVELEKESLSCGLLVRTASSIRCDCIGYATCDQRNWMIETIDSVFEQNGIIA